MTALEKKLTDRSARVGVVGMGYVGLPLAIAAVRKGFRVTGFDIDPVRVRVLASGRSHIPDVPGSAVAEGVKAGRFSATTSFAACGRCDVVVICVPTPLRKTKEPDLTCVILACRSVAAHLRKGQLIVLESTTYPGTTRELVLPMFAARGLKVGRDFHLAFSPERVDPANKKFGIANTPKVVGGVTKSCSALVARFYGQFIETVVPVRDVDTAEMVKLLENTFRAVNIAMANEMALMCHRLGVDIWEIIRAASTKPFGFMPFYPGPGLGGHCIPVDPSYLAWKMKELNFEPRLIELAANINSQMPEYTVSRIADLLNGMRKPLRGSRVLVLGVAYKPDVNDMRESPSLDVIKLLSERGAAVSYHDPFVPAVEIELGAGRQPLRLRSRPLTRAALRAAHLTAILTAHRCVDYQEVVKHSRLVFDTRNATVGMKRKNIRRI